MKSILHVKQMFRLDWCNYFIVDELGYPALEILGI